MHIQNVQQWKKTSVAQVIGCPEETLVISVTDLQKSQQESVQTYMMELSGKMLIEAASFPSIKIL